MPGPDGPDNGTDRSDAFPGIGKALWLVLALWMSELLAFTAIRAMGLFDRADAAPAWVLATLLGNGLLSATWLARKGLGYGDVIHPARASATATLALVSIPLLLILPATYLAGGIVQVVLVDLFPMSPWHLKMFAEMIDNGPAAIAGLVLVAPFVEELLFRGIILRGFLRRYSRLNALVFSSLIFGAAHLNLYQFVGAGLMGLLLGWLYMRFRSILPGMFLHAIYNGSFLATALSASGSEESLVDLAPGYVWMVALPLLLLGAYALAGLARRAEGSGPARQAGDSISS